MRSVRFTLEGLLLLFLAWLAWPVKPCQQPISFAVTSVDSKFQISQAEVAIEAATAADLWNGATGKTFLTPAPAERATVLVRLVYDERQSAYQAEQSLASQLSHAMSSFQTSQTQSKQLLSQYQNLKASYDQQVATWNSRDGAPPDVYASLEATRKQLNSLASRLNALQAQGQTQVGSINTQVDQYNALAQNTAPESGVFDGRTDTIIIYQFADRSDLRYVLTHELGHALGLEHIISDPNAIMAPERTSLPGRNVVLTNADSQAITTLCHASRLPSASPLGYTTRMQTLTPIWLRRLSAHLPAGVSL